MTLSAPEGPAHALNEARLGEIRARARLHATLGETRARLTPKRLLAEATGALRSRGADIVAETLDRIKAQPAAIGAVAGAIVLFLFRKTIARQIHALVARDDTNEGADEPFEPEFAEQPAQNHDLEPSPTMTEEN